MARACSAGRKLLNASAGDVSGVSGITTLTSLNLTNASLNVAVGYAQTNLDVNSLFDARFAQDAVKRGLTSY